MRTLEKYVNPFIVTAVLPQVRSLQSYNKENLRSTTGYADDLLRLQDAFHPNIPPVSHIYSRCLTFVPCILTHIKPS